MSFRGYRCPGMLRLSPRFFFFIIRLTALHTVYRDTFPTGYSPAVRTIEHGCHVRGQQGPIALRQQADPSEDPDPAALGRVSVSMSFRAVLHAVCRSSYQAPPCRSPCSSPVPRYGKTDRDKTGLALDEAYVCLAFRTPSRCDMNHLPSDASTCARAR